MVTIKEENYYVVQGWMRTKLGLKGNDLLIYAMLWSFSQDGLSEFRGTLDYMSDFIGANERTVRRSLEKLEEMTLIEKEVLNEKTGKTNGYKCVPLEGVDWSKVGVDKMSTPPGQNVHPPGQNVHPPLQYKEEIKHISNLYKKESKKEIYKEKQEEQVSAPAREIPNFSKMSDEEFMKFGQTQIPDFSDEVSCAIFDEYAKELERRKVEGTKWQGKVVRREGGFERLESHSEIMKKYGVSYFLEEALNEYLRFCYLNKRMVTNKQLEDLLFDLTDKYGIDENAKVLCVEHAIKHRWFSIVV